MSDYLQIAKNIKEIFVESGLLKSDDHGRFDHIGDESQFSQTIDLMESRYLQSGIGTMHQWAEALVVAQDAWLKAKV